MTPTVLIFSDAVGRGKTTFLKKWVTSQERIAGVLSPKIDGKRFFEYIPSGELLPMESTASSNLEIGKYVFDASNFKTVEERLWNDWNNPMINTVIIDEIGPLELKKEQGFNDLLLWIKTCKLAHKKTLILVVRDYCVQDCIRKYAFEGVEVFTQTDFLSTTLKRPVGLVLCGGKSERMNSEKALINYHGIPQWEYVRQLLAPFCESVYVSLNEKQALQWDVPSSVNVTIDKDIYKNHGPMTALLSLLDTLKGRPLFIIACDYPLVEMKHLVHLMKARTLLADITCFTKDNRPEPLISIFEPQALKKLTSFFEAGNDSIFKFIETNKANYCVMEDTTFLRNINSQAEIDALQKQLNS